MIFNFFLYLDQQYIYFAFQPICTILRVELFENLADQQNSVILCVRNIVRLAKFCRFGSLKFRPTGQNFVDWGVWDFKLTPKKKLLVPFVPANPNSYKPNTTMVACPDCVRFVTVQISGDKLYWKYLWFTKNMFFTTQLLFVW
jgi:hypothetical protein